MRILIAPDSFKGTLSAQAAAAAIAEGWRSLRPGDEIVVLPLADGGEGTLDSFRFANPDGEARSTDVRGPDGRAAVAQWLFLAGGTAVVELAEASGLPLMAQPDALGADTYGLGQVLAAAVEAGATRIVVGLGGSASTDGGSGALTALGAQFLDGQGVPLSPGGGSLTHLTEIDLRHLMPPPAGGVVLLSDVRSPLLGPAGAAVTFGPQKGADADQVAQLEAGLRRLAEVAGPSGIDPFEPGAGAAGGTAFGLRAMWGAEITPGATTIGELLGLEHAVRRADLVIAGEGRLDATSAQGKVISALAALTERAGKTVVAIAGEVVGRPIDVIGTALSLTDLAGGAAAAKSEPERWLRIAAARLAGQADQLAGR